MLHESTLLQGLVHAAWTAVMHGLALCSCPALPVAQLVCCCSLLHSVQCQSSVSRRNGFCCVAVLLCRLQFTRSTSKYWVHPSNILRLKLALTKQLPLLVYGTDDPVSSGDIAAAAVAAAELAVAAGSGAAPHSGQQEHKVTFLVSSGEPAAGCWPCVWSGGLRTELFS